ncbi:hypothetical protein [Marinifilum fragile]|uniref:hypothetical protein n=1 Tax=Marinifilum fragile TaxID=570161 RepID=UPI002AA79EA2|nr:hypothetical protein [Marinifilum fragile]
MEIVPIFDDILYAIKYDGEQSDEFERLFDLWRDPEYLEEFFEEHKSDINGGFWGCISIEEAILKTLSDAQHFEDRFQELSKHQSGDLLSALSKLFKPLHDSQTRVIPLNKSKARETWLRIYALRLDDDAYIITGGAIKLTKAMQDREHTEHELHKIDLCRQYFLKEGIIDTDGVIDEIEL